MISCLSRVRILDAPAHEPQSATFRARRYEKSWSAGSVQLRAAAHHGGDFGVGDSRGADNGVMLEPA